MNTQNLYISMYHYTRDLPHSRYPRIKGLDGQLFERQLQFFKENFHVVSMEQVLDAQNGGKELPERALLLTFDDGYIDHYTVAFPLLKKYGFQGSFFIPGKTFTEHAVLDVNKIHFILASADMEDLKKDLFQLLDDYRAQGGYPPNSELYALYGKASRYDSADVVFTKRMLQAVIPEEIRSAMVAKLFDRYVGVSEECFSRELYMDKNQIRCMKQDGMFFGVHGYDHYWLGGLEKGQMERDIETALDVMEPFLDRGAWVMNYPYGDFSEDVISYISTHGCVLGLTTQVRQAVVGQDDRYLLPRLDCNDFPPKSENYKEVAQ